MKKNVSMN